MAQASRRLQSWPKIDLPAGATRLPDDNHQGFVKSFAYLVTICALVFGGYWYFWRSPADISSGGEPEPDRLPAVDASGRPLDKCSRCNGTGLTKCTVSRCKEGQVDCPGKCLKLSVGIWEYMSVPGHDPKELWQKVSGSKGWHAWSTAHVGEVIAIRNGRPENIGKCPTCGGKAKVACKVCKGAATITCSACHGNKVVLARSPAVSQVIAAPQPTPSRNYETHVRLETIRLRGGRTITGRVTISDPEVSWIRTNDGKIIEVPTKRIIRRSSAGNQ
jgi:hypothetical protein